MRHFNDIGLACLWIAAAIVIGMACALASHYLTRAFWYIGATESPSQWLAYALVFCVAVFLVSAALGRINPNRGGE